MSSRWTLLVSSERRPSTVFPIAVGCSIDFLEHEMFVAALFRLNGIPGDAAGTSASRGLPVSVEQVNTVARNHRNFMLIKKENRSRVGQHCRNIRRDESFAFDAADDQRRAFPHRNNLLGIVGGQNSESEEAFEFL